ncbi:MAG: hypothetical protein CVT79_15640 [Alphaproteobacteria bacterium HGW-Alphaproteobacteria-18]|nr:MAG: hypothetical protein CVT79_15640 [Alphaproteobacteria bacterium HGW-Alphaproteobacteria-18]
MTNRVSKRLVTFNKPFSLDSIERQWPAGNYTIETEEEPLDNISLLAYRTVCTTMILHPPAGKSGRHIFIEIEPSELDAALLRDREAEGRANSEGLSA